MSPSGDRRRRLIENPILNSPFEEPTRHFDVVDGKFTENVVPGRRLSSYLIPVAKPKGNGRLAQLALQQEDEVKPNEFINEIRSYVRAWREAGYQGVTPTTRALLDWWRNPRRENRLFFAQIEAVETAIYLTEYAPKNRPAILNRLDSINRDDNEGLPRRALKMATGSGKTVVMSMIIAWHRLNKVADPKNKLFADAFLIVTPGITIRDRLRVLDTDEPPEETYYFQRDIVPPDMRDRMLNTPIVITNFHAFQPRAELDAAKLNKQILGNDLMEPPAAMVRRVLRKLRNKTNIVVLNDEAHHCYLALERDAESGEEAKAARVWFAGLKSVQAKLGIRAVYDLSATPFYLSSSGRREGTLFEWVVSDFDLTDAIESGLVKIPHTPISDDTESAVPKYRAIWPHVKDELRTLLNERKDDDRTEPQIPATLEGALRSLYTDYERSFADYEERRAAGKAAVPPAFVVVCNDTKTSKLVTDWIAGYDGFEAPVAGKLRLFSNVEGDAWINRPRTLLIDSRQLESGEALSAGFRKAAEREIEEFREAYRRRTGEDDVDDVQILREVMNTVGKRGQLGEGIRCVVSVAMLSEGWDANNVTHILGVRAFSTQLLCEQVVGRGLRRMSYTPVKTPDGERFEPEYAEVYGIPFDFYPAQGGKGKAKTQELTLVEALAERQERYEITFPIIVGYRREARPARLIAKWPQMRFEVSRRRFDVAQETIVKAYVGEEKSITYDPRKRRQTLAFEIAKTVMERYYTTPDGGEESWYFPQVLRIVQEWMRDQALFEDEASLQLLDVAEVRNAAAHNIAEAIDRSPEGKALLRAEQRRWEPLGSSSRVRFETTRSGDDLVETTKSHVSHVVCDSSWEARVAKVLESLEEVDSYVKNQSLGFVIPYVYDGQPRSYYPDFIVRWKDGSGVVNVILEVSGEPLPDKKVKAETARDRWVPAVNNSGLWGTWAFAEVQKNPYEEPGDVAAIIRSKVKDAKNVAKAQEAEAV
jgi:type III restriction enzyme